MRSLQSSSQENVLFMRLAGGIFVGLGLLLMSSGKLTTLTCNRVESTTGRCQLVSSGVLGSLLKESRQIELQGAKVENNPLDDDASRVILLTKSGEILFPSSTIDNHTESLETASLINAFINQVEKASLTVHYDGRGRYLPMGGLIITFGLFTWAFSWINRHNLAAGESQAANGKKF